MEFIKDYLDIIVEFFVDYGFSNVVSERFDVGIRFGELIS